MASMCVRRRSRATSVSGLQQLSLTGQLPAHQRDGDETGCVELVEEAFERELIAELPGPCGEQFVDLQLSGHVARPVRRLLQIEVLLEPDRSVLQPQPATRRVLAGEA